MVKVFYVQLQNKLKSIIFLFKVGNYITTSNLPSSGTNFSWCTVCPLQNKMDRYPFLLRTPTEYTSHNKKQNQQNSTEERKTNDIFFTKKKLTVDARNFNHWDSIWPGRERASKIGSCVLSSSSAAGCSRSAD